MRLPALLGLAALLGFAAASTAAPARADAPLRNYGAAFRLYVGGVKVGKANVVARFDGERYWVRTVATATGAAGFFFDAEVESVAEGVVLAGRTGVAPESFRLDMLSGEKPQDVFIRYADNRPAEIIAEPPFTPKPYELDPSRQVGALDPISAGVLAVLSAGRRAGECRLALPIFDGRRRYDILLEGVADRGREDGMASVDCRARFRRVGGFKPKYMKLPDIPFTVRAVLREDGSATPIRAWGDTPFGTVIASLRG